MHTTGDLSLDVPSVTKTAPPWSAAKAMLLSWLLPKTAAVRSGRLTLKSAYAVHAFSAMLALAVLGFLMVLERSRQWGAMLTTARLWWETQRFWSRITEDVARDPLDFTLGAVVVEVGVVIVALLFTPWGARDEPCRASVVHALKRTWLHTPHIMVALLLGGVAVFMLNRSYDHWYSYERIESLIPVYRPDFSFPANTPWNSVLSREQDLSLKFRLWEFSEGMTTREQNRPWHVSLWREYRAETVAAIRLGLITWIISALLRGIGAPRQTVAVPRQPMCERCGYNLTGLTLQSRCPECGEPVEESLGPTARRGVAWELDADRGRWRAWWRTTTDFITRPYWFGRRILLTPHSSAHRTFLAMSLIGIFAVVSAAVTFLPQGLWTRLEHPPLFTEALHGFLNGWATALALLTAGCLFSGAVSFFYRLRNERNLMGAMIQLACYFSGFLLLWTTFAAVWALLMVLLQMGSAVIGELLPLNGELLAAAFWISPNLVFAVVGLVLFLRAAAGLQYANQ